MMDHQISGKMLTVSRATTAEMDRALDIVNLERSIKIDLAKDLAFHMMNSGMIEFTRQTDPTTYTVTYRARCFMTPNDQVQILRMNGYK
jgi:hypothetical protein